MNRHPHDSCWYGFATLEGPAVAHGAWGAINFNGWIDSSIGRIELPRMNNVADIPLYLVGATYNGKLLMGGQSQQGYGTWFYTDGQWFQLSTASFGVSPCAFSQDGRYFYAVTYGAGGFYRDNASGQLVPFDTNFYVDGIRAVIPPHNEIVLGNLTKYSATYDLYEYIDFENGLAVGQGQDGLVVWYQGTRYLIEPGGCFFIRAMFDGHNLALATHKQAERQLVNWFLTVPELASFPISGADEPIPAMNKPCWVAWFEFTQPPASVPPGNAMIAIRWPLESETILRLDGSLFAYWAAGATVDDIEDKARARAPDPVLAYWDGRNWPRWPSLPANAWLGIFGYCYADETIATFEANLRALLHAVPAQYQQIAIVCQCFTSNTSLTTNLKGLVPVYARVAREYPRVNFLAPFSDQGRATGLQDHPELEPYWQQLYNGVTGTPDAGGGGGMSLDWGTVHTYGRQRWSEMGIEQQSRDAFERGENPRPIQQKAFVEITSELYYDKQIPVNLFWKAGKPDYNNPDDVANKLHHIGEDTAVDLAADTYKDIVVGMGFPTADAPHRNAEWNALGGPSPITPGDQARCGPPPNLTVIEPPDPVDPTPGHIEVLIHKYEPTASRSDPHGWTIYYEVESDRPVVWIEVGLEGDGEPAIELMFKNEPRIDGRYQRGLAIKPTVEGAWYPRVRARDDAGNEASADGATPVQVGP